MYRFEIYTGKMFNFIIGWDIGFLHIWCQNIKLTSAVELHLTRWEMW